MLSDYSDLNGNWSLSGHNGRKDISPEIQRDFLIEGFVIEGSWGVKLRLCYAYIHLFSSYKYF